MGVAPHDPHDPSLHVWMPTIRGSSGGDVYTKRLADALRQRGVEVTVEWFDRRYEYRPELLATRPAPQGATLIHTNALSAFAFARHGLPLVATEHHYVLDPAYRPFKTWLQHVYHQWVIGPSIHRSFYAADVLVVDAKFTERALSSRRVRGPVRVIPLWVDYQRFRPLETPASNKPGAFKLLFVGNATRRKGFDCIIPLARLLGDGYHVSCTGGLRGESAHTDVGNVTFLGRLSDDALIAAYQACDAIVVPSRYEGFGYSALEGMACAKPVVGFACGAVDEVVSDGVSGYLVPVDDVEALAGRCRILCSNPNLAQELGNNGRRRAVEEFDESRAMDAYLDVYEEAIKIHRTATCTNKPGTSHGQ